MSRATIYQLSTWLSYFFGSFSRTIFGEARRPFPSIFEPLRIRDNCYSQQKLWFSHFQDTSILFIPPSTNSAFLRVSHLAFKVAPSLQCLPDSTVESNSGRALWKLAVSLLTVLITLNFTFDLWTVFLSFLVHCNNQSLHNPFWRAYLFLCVGKVTQKPGSVSRKTISDSFTGGLFLWKILQSILQS